MTRGAAGRFDGIAAAVRARGAPSFSAPESVGGPFGSPGINLEIDPAGGQVLVTLDTLDGPLRVLTRPPVAP